MRPMNRQAWELAELDGLGQAELVARGEVTARELAEAALMRIDDIDHQLGSVIWRAPDLEAQLAGTRSASEEKSPLAGIPTLLKDTGAAYKGAPRWGGSRFHRPGADDHDSELVTRMRHAGLVFVGKSSGSEFGNANETSYPGVTNNPWDLGRSTGGSSAGAGAAVASGLVPLAHGSDGGGSIRWPAAWCGLFGLKPTRARNPLGPDGGEGPAGIVVAHVLTRSVRDSAAVLDAVNGWDQGQHYFAPPAASSYLDEAALDPPPLRIGFSLEAPNGRAVDEECAKAVTLAAALLADLGHQVEEAAPAYDSEALRSGFEGITWDANAAGLASLERELGRQATEDDLEPLTWWLAKCGRTRSASDHLHSIGVLHAVSRDAAQFFRTHDMFLTPATPTPPAPHVDLTPTRENVERVWDERELGGGTFFLIANVSGHPAMSVPLSWTSDDLPVGCHFMAQIGREDLLLRLAGQVERARPWAGRWPALSPLAGGAK
jgi:amidase